MTSPSDPTFLTNEPGKTLRDRFGVLLHDDTRQFDCLVGYFFVSGFYKLYPALENVAKIRILVGLQTDRTVDERRTGIIPRRRRLGRTNRVHQCKSSCCVWQIVAHRCTSGYIRHLGGQDAKPGLFGRGI